MLINIKKYYFQPALLLILLLSSVQIQAAMLFWDPASTNQPVDQNFTLTLKGSEFTEGASGGGVNVSWDSSIIELNTVVISDVFEDSAAGIFALNLIEAPVNNPVTNISSIFVAATSFFGTQLTAFDVADFLFTAVNPGQTNTTVVSLELMTDPWATFFADAIYEVDISNASAAVTVSAVPLPPAMLLFGTSLIGMLTFSRRKTVIDA